VTLPVFLPFSPSTFSVKPDWTVVGPLVTPPKPFFPLDSRSPSKADNLPLPLILPPFLLSPPPLHLFCLRPFFFPPPPRLFSTSFLFSDPQFPHVPFSGPQCFPLFSTFPIPSFFPPLLCPLPLNAPRIPFSPLGPSSLYSPNKTPLSISFFFLPLPLTSPLCVSTSFLNLFPHFQISQRTSIAISPSDPSFSFLPLFTLLRKTFTPSHTRPNSLQTAPGQLNPVLP